MSSYELTGHSAELPWLTRARLARVLALAAGLVAGTALGLLFVTIVSLRVLGFQALTVASDSMSPALETGDLIIVKPANIASIAHGDIVLFASGGDQIPTVHRVLGVNEYETLIRDNSGGEPVRFVDYGLVTAGDANPDPDAREVSAEQLMGTVWFTVPGGGALAGLPLNAIFPGFAVAIVALWMGWEINARRRRTVRAPTGAMLVFGAVAGAASLVVSLPTALAWTAPAAMERGAAMVGQVETRTAPATPAPDLRPIEDEPARTVEPSPVVDSAAVESSDQPSNGVVPGVEAPEAETEAPGPLATPFAERPQVPGVEPTPEQTRPQRTPPTVPTETPPSRR